MKTKNTILLLDKPKGISSLNFLKKIRKILKVRKIGHCGILDPNASGLMVVLIGDAVKNAEKFLKLDKEYIGLIRFHRDVERKRIEKLLKSLSRKIVTQIPPKRSAVVRKPRKRKIYSLEILDFKGSELKFRIRCESGFYVRKFASDIGEELGVGAHLQELKRTRIGKFKVEDATTLEELQKNSKPFFKK